MDTSILHNYHVSQISLLYIYIFFDHLEMYKPFLVCKTGVQAQVVGQIHPWAIVF